MLKPYFNVFNLAFLLLERVETFLVIFIEIYPNSFQKKKKMFFVSLRIKIFKTFKNTL